MTTRDEICKNKTMQRLIKEGKIFRNNLTGKRFSIILVRMQPIIDNAPWVVICQSMINKRPLQYEVKFEYLYEGLKTRPDGSADLTPLN